MIQINRDQLLDVNFTAWSTVKVLEFTMSIKFANILLATDGSEQANHAAALAGELARATGAQLHILTTHNEDLLMVPMLGAGEWGVARVEGSFAIDEVQAEIEKRAKEEVLSPAVAALGVLQSQPVVAQAWGQAAKKICEYAVDHDIDLIVMGSHGRSSFKQLLLGSISTQVVNYATCPVTVVR